jgi:hypothetical protein
MSTLEFGDIVDLRLPTSFVSVSSDIIEDYPEFFFFLYISLIKWQDNELKLLETNSCVGASLMF